MKKILKKVILNKFMAKLFIKPLLILHSLSYILIDRYSIILNNGIHPKHKIMKYQEWFKENIKPDWTILDIGCNEGIMSLLLADKAKFVYGMDFNKEYIQKAKKSRQKQNIEYICADATKYNFSQFRRIDCVILSNILEHIDKRVDFLKKLIDNIEWNDKNHRRFLFRVPMLNRDWIILYKKESGLDYRSDRNHFIEYTLEDFENELLQAQIKILNYDIKFGEIYTICEAI